MALEELGSVSVSEVAALVKKGNPDVAVVDVRDHQEFSEGHVKGAINLDSTAFTDTSLVDKLVNQLQSKSEVVVHCAKSLQRGPASAALLQQRLVELGIDKNVVVMKRGFNKFSEVYQTDSSVVETGPDDSVQSNGSEQSSGTHQN